MSLLDKASLIVTPNSYKESKLYSVIPSSGAGDMSVVRATTATRVNSAGLIEVVPRNLSEYSEIFSNSYWLKTGTTITDNATAAPNGTTTADKLVENSANSTHRILINAGISVIQSSQYTISVYAKKAERDVIQIVNNQLAGAYFNLTNGAITNISAGITASVETLSNGWYRCVISFSAVTTTERILVYLTDGTNTTYTGNGTSGAFIWGAQFENFATATEYFPTTTRLNIPRIDYTNGSCPSLLVEPQRTNLFLRSEEFDNASWIPLLATVTANTTTAPSGNVTADKFVATATTGVHILLQTAAGSVSGTTYTASVFVKAAGLSNITLLNNQGGGGIVNYNLTTSTFTLVSGVSASIQNYGNGWYRCIMTFTPNSTGNFNLQVRLADSSGNTTFLGNGVGGVSLWGFQVELGSFATSLIPTQGSSVTRNADVISKTGISSLIGQTEGTIFLEADIQKRNASEFYIGISNGYSLGEAIYLNQPSSGNLNVLFRTGALTPTILVLSANWNAGNNKIAIAYNSTLGEVFINGVSKGTVALTAVPTCNQIALASRTDSPGGLIGAGPYKQAILYKTRLSNTELAQLTTL